MRIAHITDLHVERPLTLAQLASKRAAAAFNLHVLGRASKFGDHVVRALVEAVVEQKPDVVVCTGDLTSTGTEREFADAARLLEPITRSIPLLALPGNHDVYTRDGVGRLERLFPGSVPGGRFPYVSTHAGLDVIAIDATRPWWSSQGLVPQAQLNALADILAQGSNPALLMLHYPLRDRRGAPYRPFTRNLSNASELEALLGRHPRVIAVLHGHEHHGYRTIVQFPGRSVTILNPGASGYAHLPGKRRTGHFNVYEWSSGNEIAVERFRYDGDRFVPEPGGAYATGR